MSIKEINSKNETITSSIKEPLVSLPGGTGNEELDRAIKIAGYSYDSVQDIFFSDLDPWQRKVGYCRIYDEAAAPLGMILDCEPIYFEYQGRKWMIGLWKGQYDMVTGGEIGIYTGILDINIPDLVSGTFYNAVSNVDMLQMSFSLKKNGNSLFIREGRHWWLTGFKLGEFSEPSELEMDTSITFDNELMRDAFITGLRKAGYTDNLMTIDGNKIRFIFSTPRTPQPITRTKETDQFIQRKNQLLCEKYLEITGPYDTFPDKVIALKEQAPEIFNQIQYIGKNKKLYELLIIFIMFGTSLLSYLTASKETDQ